MPPLSTHYTLIYSKEFNPMQDVLTTSATLTEAAIALFIILGVATGV